VASKRLLEGLIDRQLLVAEATKEKLDRDPKVVQAIERARADHAQAYIQKKVGTPAKPSANEVNDYYTQNPVFFAERKLLNMRQPGAADRRAGRQGQGRDRWRQDTGGGGCLAGEQSHQVWPHPGGAQQRRSAAGVTSKLLAMKGQLFIVREGERSLLIAITDIKDAPVTRSRPRRSSNSDQPQRQDGGRCGTGASARRRQD
jgi:hypothetical protein